MGVGNGSTCTMHVVRVLSNMHVGSACNVHVQNRVITVIGKSRLCARKCATYLVMKAKCSRVIAVSVHSFLSTAIG